ncbi:hypothetical protein DPEC_G00153310 [Dallia pectoralis]|uniref:Uncharacterized protein n=1 Tax=Dallia pectoralis TaxID=75939 RepID=A0ACC2GJX1_DALPE|nr:hypothetical protein DPEC_G00153310 [Dallia pectoralis]
MQTKNKVFQRTLKAFLFLSGSVAAMSLSASDLTELMEIWEEFNLTSEHYGDNLSAHHVEALLCSPGYSFGAVLYTLSIFYIFIFLVGLAANSLVVWVNIRSEGKRYETHLYILNLAVADLCVVATLPVWVSSLLQRGHWPFGEAVCKITHLVFSVNLFGSIFFLTCMSVDRYLSVALFGDGGNSRRKKVVRRVICILVWLLALAASVPDTYFLRAFKPPHLDATLCRPIYPDDNAREWMVGIQLSFIVLGFAIPFPVIAGFYLLLARAVSNTNPAGAGTNSNQERSISRKIILTYIVVFLVCWLPYHGVLLVDTLSILNLLPFSCRLDNFLFVALHLTQGLSLLHSCVNPIVYNFINRNYRYDLMKAFIFKYSTKTGLAKLIDASRVSETEYLAVSAVENNV